MSINWCTKYDDFESKNKNTINNLEKFCFRKELREELFKFILELIRNTYRSCEEYDSRFFDENGEFYDEYSEIDMEEEKLESFLLWSFFIEPECSYWFGPYNDYRKVDDDTFIVYVSNYYDDGSFSRTEDKYTFSFKDQTADSISCLITDLMEHYKRVDNCLDYESEIEEIEKE